MSSFKNQIFKKKYNNDKDDKLLSIAVMSSFIILPVQYFILTTLNLLDSSIGDIIQTLSKVIAAVFYLVALPIVVRRKLKISLFIYCLALFIVAINFLFYPGNRNILPELIFPIFFISLPALLYTMSIKKLEVFYGIVKKTSFIVFLISGTLSILVILGITDVGLYSMSLAYYLLLPCLIYLNECFDKLTMKSFVITSLSILFILLIGSRGPLLGIGVFTILKVAKINKEFTLKSLIIKYLFISSVFFFFLYYKILIKKLIEYLDSKGIYSRTLNELINDEVHLSGRDQIYTVITEKISNAPFMGIGIGGDRNIIGTYSHNFFIEILSNFGVLIGGIIVVLVSFLIMKCLIKTQNQFYSFYVLWISIGFVQLLISSSYLTDMKFWVLIGLSVSLLTKSIPNEKYENEEKKVSNFLIKTSRKSV